jgi:hypothetical protein
MLTAEFSVEYAHPRWKLFLLTTQFLGQQNITNAYVSGMREDLNAFGNELNYYNVACKCLPPNQSRPHADNRQHSV